MKQGLKKFWYLWDKVGVLLLRAVIFIFYALINPRIIAPQQLITTLSRSAITGIAAAGMTFAICSGGFDLSVGSIVSLVSCVLASLITKGYNTWVTVLIAIAVAACCGIVNGLLISKLKIQAFVATLATQLAFAGVALVYSGGIAVQITSKFNKSLKILSTGKLFGFVPMPIVVVLSVFLIAYLIYRYSVLGTRIRAIGSNETAARTTGINTDMTIIFVYIITAVSAALAATLNTARLSTGDPGLGSGFELDAITAVILGGTALSGGKGNIWGTLVGAVLVTFVKMGLNMLGVGEAYQKLAVAAVLVFALTISGTRVLQKGVTAN
jgi:ribose/xylose/arabinose/galactoside ABC-type transport system permease subunit